MAQLLHGSATTTAVRTALPTAVPLDAETLAELERLDMVVAAASAAPWQVVEYGLIMALSRWAPRPPSSRVMTEPRRPR